jgi:hypothetical protein
MGGVNFTRNRAWWHTTVWDEYGQRFQYTMLIPTMMTLIPFYWYGAFLNRDLEQNFAAKMYQLDYENKRYRLTHNMIMEHFEMHVEKVQDIYQEVKVLGMFLILIFLGFEETFKEQMVNPFRKEEREYGEDFDFDSDELMAEIDEYSGMTKTVDNIIEHTDLPVHLRQRFEKSIIRRKYPNTPYKYLDKGRTENYQPIIHLEFNPIKSYRPENLEKNFYPPKIHQDHELID